MSKLSQNDVRYENDPAFHGMVTSLMAIIENLDLTPSELREAAMYAAYLVEVRRTARYTFYVPGEVEDLPVEAPVPAPAPERCAKGTHGCQRIDEHECRDIAGMR